MPHIAIIIHEMNVVTKVNNMETLAILKKKGDEKKRENDQKE